jgi:hypothetical protein
MDFVKGMHYCTVSVGLGLTECCSEPDVAVTTMVYVPAGVPGLPTFVLPPQAVWKSAPATSKHANRKRSLCVRFRLIRLVPPNSMPSTGSHVAYRKREPEGDTALAIGPVVLTVRTAFAPTSTVAGLTEHVGDSATDDCTEQDSVIDPLNPPVAVVVMVELEALPGLTAAGVRAEAETAKSGRGGRLNTASRACVELTVHTLLFAVEQLPDQPPKVESVLGLAVSVTVVPTGKAERQSGGQLMPLGLLDTRPVPRPEKVTETLKTGEVVAGRSKTRPQPETQFEFPPVVAVP